MNIFSKSENFKEEYSATIVKIGELVDIEGADNLKKTVVDGFDIVVNKNEVHSGDVMVYCKNETQLNKDFLRLNSMFDNRELNADSEKKGYIPSNGRIRIIKLRGCPSMGILLDYNAILNWKKDAKIDISEYIGEHFDTVSGELFCRAYMPEPKEHHTSTNKRDKRLKKYNRMIPGEFSFHYDTKQLNDNINRLNPDDIITVSVKLHGTSAIYGNVLCKAPKFGGAYSKLFPRLPKFLQFTKKEYTDIYSSRSVIKNDSIGTGFYKEDVWKEYHDILKGTMTPGLIIYGEIVGYAGKSMIQKGWDYGCKPGENRFVIYRATYNGNEMSIGDVIELNDTFNDTYPENGMKFPLLYSGPVKNLYTDIDYDAEDWRSVFLERLKNDKSFYMEKNEPLCTNKIPREGIVLRIEKDDPKYKEAFKLKCRKFLFKESEMIDQDEVDMEMEQGF